MKKIIFPLIATLFITSCASLKNLNLAPTNFETITALKEILNSGAFKAAKTLQQMSKNGVDGLLPEELQPVLATLKSVGLGSEIEKITNKVGEVSGVVAQESSGILKDAISELNFTDAVAVVLGGEDAATRVLKEAMYGSVKKRYSIRLETELDKTEVNQYWPMAVGAYNLFAKNKVEGSLSDFLAERAVDALFISIGKREATIRKDPPSLGSAVVTKVFDYYQNKKN